MIILNTGRVESVRNNELLHALNINSYYYIGKMIELCE
jgi:hypothetical protein